jgi:hypothetical protein
MSMKSYIYITAESGTEPLLKIRVASILIGRKKFLKEIDDCVVGNWWN